jgi:hypothetical protein
MEECEYHRLTQITENHPVFGTQIQVIHKCDKVYRDANGNIIHTNLCPHFRNYSDCPIRIL